MSGETNTFLVATLAVSSRPGEYHGYCPVHDDRRGNRSLDIEFKAKDVDRAEDGTEYPRWYIHCRSCGASGPAVTRALGIDWYDLQSDAVASGVRARPKRPWPLPTGRQVEDWCQARRGDAAATRWLTEERLLRSFLLDRYRIGWNADRRWWIFPVLYESDCFVDPVAVSALWYPADPMADGRRKMCCWGGAPLYLYPDVPGGLGVLLTEGPLDALVGRSHGLRTVSATQGAGQWSDRLTEELRGKQVVVAYDCDDAGRAGAADRVKDLTTAGIAARVHDLDPSRDDGFDLTDFFREGGTATQLRADVKRGRAPGPTPKAPPSSAPRSRDKNGRRRE